MQTTTATIELLDAAAISLSEVHGNNRYVTHEAINLAKANPGKSFRLNGGKLVSRTYAIKLHKSAQQLDEKLAARYLGLEATRKTSKSGNAYTVSKGLSSARLRRSDLRLIGPKASQHKAFPRLWRTQFAASG